MTRTGAAWAGDEKPKTTVPTMVSKIVSNVLTFRRMRTPLIGSGDARSRAFGRACHGHGPMTATCGFADTEM
ncbi:hypothetical protein Aph01nite_32950 [Acrocarpospora phusangensis]|uniref:Uncharacterized protein n=1 Tax=Acrocarpospora phusangensis TaxID=1070424 RepID=A0A919QEA6_9ACTN|nr:hypothetical protein Aph01nite_32950 [Acrocarpospora phusangensis]